MSEHSHRADGRVWIAGWSFSSVVVTSLMEKCRRQVVGMIPGGNPAKLGRSGVRGDGRAAETLAEGSLDLEREVKPEGPDGLRDRDQRTYKDSPCVRCSSGNKWVAKMEGK